MEEQRLKGVQKKPEIGFNEELKVIQIKKKHFDMNNLPGSSPEQRAGIRDIQFKYQHGKAPMIEKRDTKYRKMGKDLPYPEEDENYPAY